MPPKVSNWRCRADFPKNVAGRSSPMCSNEEIQSSFRAGNGTVITNVIIFDRECVSW